MSEWNLSVRLTGQGSNLASTLKGVSRDAKTASRDVNALKRDIAELRREARNDIRVRLDVDSGHLRRDVRAALSSAGAGQGLAVNLSLGNPQQLRREVEVAVRRAARGHRIEIPIGLRDPRQLRRDVSAAVRQASMNQTIRVRVDPDTSRLRAPLPGVPTPGVPTPGGAAPAAAATAKALGSLLPITTALVPLVAGLSATILSAAGSMGVGGAAAIAYGAALAGQIGPLKEAAEAEKAYQDAVAEHGRGSREAAQAQLAYQRQLAAMPPETQKAAVALSRLKTQFGDWSDDMAGFTMEPVTKGMVVLGELLPHLSPEVKAFSGSMDRLMTVAGGAINTAGFEALSDRAAELTEAKLDDFTDSVIHLFRIISDGSWDDGALGTVLDYMRENGPAAREAINSIGDAVGNLIEASSVAGPSMLTLVTATADLVAAIPPQAVAVILQAAFALKVLTLAGAAATKAGAGIAAVRVAILGMGTAAAAAGGGIAGLRAAFLSLGTAAKASVVVAGIGLAVYALHELSSIGKDAPADLDKVTSSMKRFGATGKLSGESARVFGKDFEKLGDSVQKVSDPEGLDQVQQSLTSFFGMDSTPVMDAAKNIDDFDEGLANLVKNGNAEQAEATLKGAMEALKADGKDVGAFREKLDGYDEALADAAFEAEHAAGSMSLFGRAAADVQAQLDAQKQAADGLRNSLVALNETNRDAYSAEINYERAVDDLTKAFKENGNTLDTHSEAGRLNGEAMVTAAKAQDDLIVSGIAAGESFETMSQKSRDLRGEMLELATKGFGGNKKKAEEYVNTLLNTPEYVDTIIRAETEKAVTDLEAVKAQVASTKGKTITMTAPTAAARAQLEALGFKIEDVPGTKNVTITIPTGPPTSAVNAIQGAINGMHGKNIGIGIYKTEYLNTVRTGSAIDGKKYPGVTPQASGSVLDFYADGGMRESHVAQIAPAGQYRVWAERETGGESYIPLSPAKRPRSRAIAEETVRRLGGDPTAIQWNANGSVTAFAGGGFTYKPTGTMNTITDVSSAYNDAHQPITKDEYSKKIRARANAVDSLRAAEAKLAQVRRGRHTRADLTEAETRVTKARRSLATATEEAKKAEDRYRKQFSLADWQKTLAGSVKANVAYEANLKRITDRGGADVVDQLRGMGEEGAAMVAALAKASNKQFQDIVNNLKKLGPLAKATLADYTSQLNTANKTNAQFQANLTKLASMGYGDLASQLLAQGDEAAMGIASAAVKDTGKAKAANEEVKRSKSQLTDDQQAALIQIIAAIKDKSTGIHAVAAATGLGEDEIIEVGTKARPQLTQFLGGRADRFLADLGKASKGMAYADGGIRAGLYGTQGGIIRFAEPETRGEAYIPLGANKRRTALPVLADVAHRFGVGLTDANSGKVVVIREAAPVIGNLTNHITSVDNAKTIAREISSQVGRSVRRAHRGGVAARGH